jgi:hypothetical protein
MRPGLPDSGLDYRVALVMVWSISSEVVTTRVEAE